MRPHDEAQGDPFFLQRFVIAQSRAYATALGELRRGGKGGHWMWFIFPQFEGLGSSETSQHFAIRSLDEARAFLGHPVLGTRLLECCETLLGLKELSASDVFGYPDDRKLRSSMTLFDLVASPDSPFARVLDRYFDGVRDGRTIRLAEHREGGPLSGHA
jgi:uncharacterized protein (DUF1810 family)